MRKDRFYRYEKRISVSWWVRFRWEIYLVKSLRNARRNRALPNKIGRFSWVSRKRLFSSNHSTCSLPAIETTARSIESKSTSDRRSIGTSTWSGEEITSKWPERVNHFTDSICLLIFESSSRALLLLRRKKMLEMQLNKSEGILENVDRMVTAFLWFDRSSLSIRSRRTNWNLLKFKRTWSTVWNKAPNRWRKWMNYSNWKISRNWWMIRVKQRNTKLYVAQDFDLIDLGFFLDV